MTALQHNVSDVYWKSPGNDIEILTLSVQEEISELYQIQAQIVSDNPGLAFSDMLYSEAKIELMCGDELTDTRYFGGIITRFGQARTRFGQHDPSDKKTYVYHVEIHPKLWLLTRQTRSRVYQQVSAEDITKEILGEFGIANRWTLGASPSIRDYCVQYQETDFAFISRDRKSVV